MKVQIPNPNGEKLKIGDKITITQGEFAGYVGEVIEFVKDGQNWVKLVKIAKGDGKFETVEVKELAIELFKIVDKIIKSNIFKRIANWFKKVFGKKKKKKKN